MKSVENLLKDTLQKNFQVDHLEVINESHSHNVPKDSETHFKIILVSPDFQNQTLVNRHRKIHENLKNALFQNIHALSLKLYTPEEWQAQGQAVEVSPPCLGGSKA